MVRFPRMYHFLENGLPMTALFSKVHQLLGNAIGNEAAYSENHCVLGNLQPIRGYDFQKVLHIRKNDGRTNMVFQKCMTFRKNADGTGPFFPEKPLIEHRPEECVP